MEKNNNFETRPNFKNVKIPHIFLTLPLGIQDIISLGHYYSFYSCNTIIIGELNFEVTSCKNGTVQLE